MPVRFDNHPERQQRRPAAGHHAPRDAGYEAADLTLADLDAIQAYFDREARQSGLLRSWGRRRPNVRTTQFHPGIRKPSGGAK